VAGRQTCGNVRGRQIAGALDVHVLRREPCEPSRLRTEVRVLAKEAKPEPPKTTTDIRDEIDESLGLLSVGPGTN
jgi:hypothetical protein